MSRREEKRELAAYHDSGRYLKRHPPRLSDPLFGLAPRAEWADEVRMVLRTYPKLARCKEAALRAGGIRAGRRGPSAENVLLWHSAGAVAAVEAALDHFPMERRRRLCAVCFQRTERCRQDWTDINLLQRYVAVYLGYGRARYDLKSI